MSEDLIYNPTPTAKAFIKDYIPGALFYSWIVGPVGSGKTTADFMKLIYMSQLQTRNSNGTRVSRCVIVRNTTPQLKDTTMKSWFDWFKPGVAGDWHATDKIFDLKFGDVECEVLFRALDTEDDIARVLSLEVTFAIIDEFREVPKAIIDALSGRIGRYPSKRHGGATNHGMWGASNPGTEDVWWYDYLHNQEISDKVELFGAGTEAAMRRLLTVPTHGRTTRYFHQPGGMTDYAENLENLPPYEPGNKSYYINQARGKSAAWIKQYVDAEWGYSASETPVIKSFNADIHIARSRPRYSPLIKLVAGADPGIQGTAWLFGQEDLHGRLLVLGEIGSVGVGATRFVNEIARPYMRTYFPEADFILSPDPAASNRGQTDGRAVVDIYKSYYQVREETNNRLSLRLDAIDHYATRLTEVGPALVIDKEMCPMLCRALAGGWRYEKVKRSADDGNFKAAPEKNNYSHYGDAFGYLCRYFHRMYLKSGRHGGDRLAGLQGSARPLLQSRPVNYFQQ